MSHETNGDKPETPIVQTVWDEARKDVSVGFDMRVFKNIGFVIAVYKLGLAKLEQLERFQLAQQQMAMINQAQADARLAQAIKQPGIIPAR